MADIGTRSFLGSQMKSLDVLLGLLCLMLLMRSSSAREFVVGGSDWTLHGNNSAINYNQWAERNRFQIGDSIVFNYQPGQDSVLQVTREDYSNCTTTSPLHKYSTGHTVFTFNQSGPHYFISGNKDNCLKNQKLTVVVLADRSNMSSSTNSTSPPPSGMAPAPVPTSDNYSPPPSGTVEGISPTPSSTIGPKKNAATSVYFGSVGCIGALVASSLIFSIQI